MFILYNLSAKLAIIIEIYNNVNNDFELLCKMTAEWLTFIS